MIIWAEMITANDLVTQIKTYNPDIDPGLIEKAVDFARVKHEGQTRASGEPYYTHPVEVAGLLADMKMDAATIVTAILHDTLEDTDATMEAMLALYRAETVTVAQAMDSGSRMMRECQFVDAQGKPFAMPMVNGMSGGAQ